MEQKEVDTDDTTAIQYIPYQVDYFGKVFHPKQFVKEHDVVGVSSLKSTQDDFQKKQPIYTSIYNGIMDISNEKEEKQIKHSFTPDEEKQASELYHRILEIEKEHANESKVSCIDDQSSLQFVVNQCGCPECSPRLRDNDIMYCELCDVVLRDDNWIHHTQSICHQVKRQNKVHVYVNPFMNPSSSAFKVMTAMGWEEGQGLGKEGQGRLEPIPTRLKNNRLGIGAADSMPLRITHTPHNDDADPNEDPIVTKERERLIHKYGLKRLRKIIKKYNEKKRMKEMKQREEWLRNEFRL